MSMKFFTAALAVMALASAVVMAQASADSRLPVPDVAAQKEALKLVNEVFKDDMDKAKTAELKVIFAKKLLQQAAESKDDVAGRYVLLQMAADQAADAGEVNTALGSVDQLTKAFNVDAPKLRAILVPKLAAALKLPESGRAALTDLIGTETSNPSSPGEQMKLGDGWWDLGQSVEGTSKKSLLTRAGRWYEQSMPKLTGLLKAKVEKRLKEIGLAAGSKTGEAEASTPANNVPPPAIGSLPANKETALKWLKKAEEAVMATNSPMQLSILCDIANIENRAGEKAALKQTIELILQIYRKNPKAFPAYMNWMLVKQLASIGTITGARDIAQQCPNPSTKALGLVEIAKAQFQSGDKEGFTKTIGEAVSETSAIVEPALKVEADSRIAEAQWMAGDKTAYHHTLELMQAVAFGIRDKTKGSALAAISEAQATAGDIAEASASVAKITDNWQKDSAQCGVIKAQLKLGQLVEAKANARSITSPYNRSVAYLAIAEQCKTAKDGTGMREAIRLAKEAAMAGPNGPSLDALSSVSEAELKAGDVAGCRQTLETLKSMAATNQRMGAHINTFEIPLLRGGLDEPAQVEALIASLGSDQRIFSYVAAAKGLLARLESAPPIKSE